MPPDHHTEALGRSTEAGRRNVSNTLRSAAERRPRPWRGHKPSWLGRRLTSPLRVLPDFLIIGAQKSGTTALFDYLVQHPDVRRPPVKEIHYFDHNYGRGSRWYRSHFPPRPAWQRTWQAGEASPFYLCHPLVPSRAAAIVPSARLAVILRNPVDRAYSHFQWARARGEETLTFEEAIDRETARTSKGWQRLASGCASRSVETELFSYLARGLYGDQIQRWLQHFPRQQLLVLVAEELAARLESVMNAALSHLSLTPFGGWVFAPKNARSYEPMPADVRERLGAYYRKPVELLSSLVGMEFPWRL